MECSFSNNWGSWFNYFSLLWKIIIFMFRLLYPPPRSNLCCQKIDKTLRTIWVGRIVLSIISFLKFLPLEISVIRQSSYIKKSFITFFFSLSQIKYMGPLWVSNWWWGLPDIQKKKYNNIKKRLFFMKNRSARVIGGKLEDK